MKPSLLFACLALIAILPASALAFRASPGAETGQAAVVRSLRRGDTGEPVAALQRLLLSRGFDPGPIDGIFGPLTERAVLAAQRYHALAEDGLAGPLTLGALQEQPPAGEPSQASAAVQSQAPSGGQSQDPGTLQTQGPEAGRRAGPAALQRPLALVEPVLPEKDGLVFYEAKASVADAGPAGGIWAGSDRTGAGRAGTDGPGQPGPGLAGAGLTGAVPNEATAGSSANPATAVPEAELALTFNHLPPEEDLEPLLSALGSRAMKATFFVTGEEAEDRPEALRRIQEAGHEIGSLGYAEVDMRRLSARTARSHLRRARRAVQEATGAAPTLFRPPLGRFDGQLEALAAEEGMRLVLWSNATQFTEPGMAPARVAERLTANLFPSMVLMLSLDRPEAAGAVEPLLDRIAAAGYRGRLLGAALSTETDS